MNQQKRQTMTETIGQTMHCVKFRNGNKSLTVILFAIFQKKKSIFFSAKIHNKTSFHADSLLNVTSPLTVFELK